MAEKTLGIDLKPEGVVKTNWTAIVIAIVFVVSATAAVMTFVYSHVTRVADLERDVALLQSELLQLKCGIPTVDGGRSWGRTPHMQSWAKDLQKSLAGDGVDAEVPDPMLVPWFDKETGVFKDGYGNVVK